VTDSDPIADARILADTCAALALRTRLAVDTEFLRERTYDAQLALVQLGADEVYLIDPLRAPSLEPLAELLLDGRVTKVLHAARQDLEVLLPLTRTPATPVLDTQLAAALLGMPPQIGLAALVSQVLGIELAKAQGANLARTDWTRRPLSAAQLAYARDDVRHLLPLVAVLEEQLEAKGRLAWLVEECAQLGDPVFYRQDPATAWQRLKGIESAPIAEQQRLRALARWREERAQRRNLPRGWVLADEALRDLARQPPADAAHLASLGIFRDETAMRLAPEIFATLAAAAQEWPAETIEHRDGRVSAEEQALLQRLAARTRRVAAEHGLAAELLATQRDLRNVVRGARAGRPFAGWRAALIGAPLLEECARG
jgi:ribonuclease D